MVSVPTPANVAVAPAAYSVSPTLKPVTTGVPPSTSMELVSTLPVLTTPSAVVTFSLPSTGGLLTGAKSLSTIVVLSLPATPLICSDSKLPPLALAICSWKLSLPSMALSLMVAILKFALDEPAGMVTEAMPLKSLPSAATPE